MTHLNLNGCGHLANVNVLGKLTSLTSLGLSLCNISRVDCLSKLTSLTSLNLSYTGLLRLPSFLPWLPALKELYLSGNMLENVPVEVLGRFWGDNCLQAVRAHFTDLQSGRGMDDQLKVLFLGDGRVGKTSMINRLAYGKAPDPNESSTHSVQFHMMQLDGEGPDNKAMLRLWDFGGQDIYLGTHCRLFSRGDAYL